MTDEKPYKYNPEMNPYTERNPMAFAAFTYDSESGDGAFQEGMTLRDYFAAAALTGILANPAYNDTTAEADAQLALFEADAMLEARKEPHAD